MDIPICNRALDVILLDFERHFNIDKFNHTSDGLLTMISIYIEKRCEFPKNQNTSNAIYFFHYFFGLVKISMQNVISQTRDYQKWHMQKNDR